MFKMFKSIIAVIVALTIIFAVNSNNSFAQQKPKVRIAWSIYVGWMPWDYAATEGILKKWGDRYGADLELTDRMAYDVSLTDYVAGNVQACVMTNMEALDMPCAAGIRSTALIIGDYSNGNDAILVRDNITASTIKGHNILLVEKTVSQYLLSRFLTMNGLKERDIKIENTTDLQIEPVFTTNKNRKVVVTWNPMVMNIMKLPGIKKIFDSSKIPGEILDLLIVRTDVLEAHPEVGEALVGAWYEVMQIMTAKGTPESKEAIKYMADQSGCSVTEYESQLKTTMMYWKSKDAADFAESTELKAKMNYVRQFCFDHGLLGENAANVDVVGIKYPDGSIQGDPKNVTFFYDSHYMKMHAEGRIDR